MEPQQRTPSETFDLATTHLSLASHSIADAAYNLQHFIEESFSVVGDYEPTAAQLERQNLALASLSATSALLEEVNDWLDHLLLDAEDPTSTEPSQPSSTESGSPAS